MGREIKYCLFVKSPKEYSRKAHVCVKTDEACKGSKEKKSNYKYVSRLARQCCGFFKWTGLEIRVNFSKKTRKQLSFSF